MVMHRTERRSSVANMEIAMKTISEKTKRADEDAKLQAAPRLPDVMSIAQREQSAAFQEFFRSRPRTERSRKKQTPNTGFVFGAR
jgi:hypothetical protein